MTNYESWTMKTGKKIKITKMTTEHLKNVLNMLESNIAKYNNKCMNYGDDCGGIPEYFVKQYNELVKEYNKRRKQK